MARKSYEVVADMPVCKLFYQGHHSHPVRRTGLIIQETDDKFVVYELRNGDVVRDIDEAKGHIKSYRKDKIARFGDYVRLSKTKMAKYKLKTDSTLRRLSLADLINEGI